MDYTLIDMAAGEGTRMGKGLPKQFLLLGGRPLLFWSLRAAAACPDVNEVIVVANPRYLEETEQVVRDTGLTQPWRIVPGGEVRQDSVRAGLLKASCEAVLLHEAARPFVRAEDFQLLLNESEENATYARRVPFTVLEGGDHLEAVLDRSRLWNIQMPQKFRREVLLGAHEEARRQGRSFTDDSSLFFSMTGLSVKVLEGREENIKVTTPTDLRLGMQMLDFIDPTGKERRNR